MKIYKIVRILRISKKIFEEEKIIYIFQIKTYYENVTEQNVFYLVIYMFAWLKIKAYVRVTTTFDYEGKFNFFLNITNNIKN